MAKRFNRFGCKVSDVLTLLKTGSYDPATSDFGGEEAIAAFIDDSVDDIIQMMPEAMFQSIFDVVLEKVEQRASEGQTIIRTGLKPLVSGKTHVWTGTPSYFKTRPRLLTDVLGDMVFTSPELVPLSELGSDAFDVADSTGVITLRPAYSMRANYQAFVTYSVDVDSPSFCIDSLANVAAAGALAKLGSKFYARGSSNWAFIEEQRNDYGNKITDLRDGKWLPNEIRQMRYWQEVVPEADKKTMIQMGRIRRG